MKISVNELKDIALDWAVGKALKLDYSYNGVCDPIQQFKIIHRQGKSIFSSSWTWGGPIIDQFKINIVWETSNNRWEASANHYELCDGYHEQSALIAAMRAFVYQNLGSEVEVPDSICS